MQLAFLFDTTLEKYNNHYYSVSLGKELWDKRYFPYFSKIVLVCRYKNSMCLPQNKNQVDIEGVEILAFENNVKVNRIFSILKEKEAIRNVIKNCDAVVCRGFWGAAECRKQNKPYIVEVVSCLWDAMWNYSFLGKLVALPMHLSLKHAVKKADFVFYVTEHFLQSKYPSDGICAGVSDVISFPSNENEKERRRKKILELKNSPMIKIGTVAAVNVPYKGQRFVIGALKLLEDRGIKNIEYHMVGGGSTENLKKIAAKYGVLNRIVFRGPLLHDDVQKFLDEIDIYIQPSLQEGLPRAVVEAMSRGVPCIGTNVGGIPELIKSDYICDKRKKIETEIADKIMLMLKDNNMLAMSEYSYVISNKYTPERLDKKRTDFMNKFVKQI